MTNPVIDEYGTQRWYKNGKIHREDGPAVIYASGSQEWRINGKLHRTDGPAVIYADGFQAWWLYGRNYEFNDYVNEIFPLNCKEKMVFLLKYQK